MNEGLSSVLRTENRPVMCRIKHNSNSKETSQKPSDLGVHLGATLGREAQGSLHVL